MEQLFNLNLVLLTPRPNTKIQNKTGNNFMSFSLNLPFVILFGKAQNLHGYWQELRWNTESMKYFEAVPNPRFRTSAMRAEWTGLQAELVRDRGTCSADVAHLACCIQIDSSLLSC